MPICGSAGYLAAKASVGMLTRNAALELAKKRIRTNAVFPGLLRRQQIVRLPSSSDGPRSTVLVLACSVTYASNIRMACLVLPFRWREYLRHRSRWSGRSRFYKTHEKSCIERRWGRRARLENSNRKSVRRNCLSNHRLHRSARPTYRAKCQ